LKIRVTANPKKITKKITSACLKKRVLAGTNADYRLLLTPTRTRVYDAAKQPSARGEAPL
jgi:hypothetical protein